MKKPPDPLRKRLAFLERVFREHRDEYALRWVADYIQERRGTKLPSYRELEVAYPEMGCYITWRTALKSLEKGGYVRRSDLKGREGGWALTPAGYDRIGRPPIHLRLNDGISRTMETDPRCAVSRRLAERKARQAARNYTQAIHAEPEVVTL